ncbi:hypothetical protein AAVH_23719, partial [Aphelenchoides avenae]
MLIPPKCTDSIGNPIPIAGIGPSQLQTTNRVLHTDFQFYRFCTTDAQCMVWASGRDALIAEEGCLVNDGSPNNVLDVIIAQTLANYCNYADAACSMEKTGNSDSGYCYHEECGG